MCCLFQNPSCLPLFTPISLLRSKAPSSARVSPCSGCQCRAMKHGKEFHSPQDAGLPPHPASAGRSRLGSKVVLHASLSHRSLPPLPRQPGLRPGAACQVSLAMGRAAFPPAASPGWPASRFPPAILQPRPACLRLLPPPQPMAGPCSARLQGDVAAFTAALRTLVNNPQFR